MENAMENQGDEVRRRLRSRKILFFLSAASLMIIIAASAVLIWKIPPTDQTVFLHYNIYFGIDKTGPWWQLLIIPGSGLSVFLLNTMAIMLMKHMDSIIKILLAAVTLGLEIMCAVAVVFIILLNRQ